MNECCDYKSKIIFVPIPGPVGPTGNATGPTGT